jgi:hypothetical protein
LQQSVARTFRSGIATETARIGGDDLSVPDAAPRIDERLVAALARLDQPGRPIAETHRRVGRIAEELGLSRPSYEQARVIVHSLRSRSRASDVGAILLDVVLRTRPPEAILEALAP